MAAEECPCAGGPVLPPHLSVLVGSLRGPEDLGRNHDAYLSDAGRGDSGGAAISLSPPRRPVQRGSNWPLPVGDESGDPRRAE